MKEVQAITDPYEIFFPNLGWKFHINPTAFTVFGVEIKWYGVIIALGLLLATIYCFPKMKRFGVDADKAVDAVIGGVFGGLVGARIYYVACRWEYYKGDIMAIINTRNGGLAIYGGIIGAVTVGLVICKIKKIKILPMLDIAVIGFLIGQGVGRWGNFVNQEAFGANTDSLFAMTGGTIQNVIAQNASEMSAVSISEKYAVHPCFLYESVWCILGFFVLSFMSKRRKYDGQIFLMYLMWYGLERFIVEGLRTDSLMTGNIRVSQALSIIVFICSVIVQIIMHFRVKRDPENYVLYASTPEWHRLMEKARREKNGISDEELI